MMIQLYNVSLSIIYYYEMNNGLSLFGILMGSDLFRMGQILSLLYDIIL